MAVVQFPAPAAPAEAEPRIPDLSGAFDYLQLAGWLGLTLAVVLFRF